MSGFGEKGHAKTSQHRWDVRFMRLAREVSGWSKDLDEGVGSVIVSPDRRRITYGYNGLPRGANDGPEVLCDHNLKNRLSVHAEANALHNRGDSVEGWTLYVTKAPCFECAKAIVQNRIARVVSTPIQGESRWKQDQQDAQFLMESLGVEVVWISADEMDGQEDT